MDHALTSAVATAIPLVLRHIPLDLAAELGRPGGQRSSERRRGKRKRDEPPVAKALRELRTSVPLFEALEPVVDALDVPVPPELVAHLALRDGTFGMAWFIGDDQVLLDVRRLEVLHAGAADLVLETARELVRDKTIAPLLAVGPEHTDEQAVAGAHGAVHVALCVAVSAGLLRALDTEVARGTRAVVGTALGAAVLLLADLPMPDSYAAAVLEKRRAEYVFNRTSSHLPAVRDHRFALAEGPVPDDVDFSANGLVAAVPGGVVLRTGQAEGPARVSLTVRAEPPVRVDTTSWDDVVEVSWVAETGDARFGRGTGTPPWPGEYRALAQVTGRDEGGEEWSVTVWAAPVADAVAHKLTDRLGHRLRGEPEPPVVVPPELEHRWIEDTTLAEAGAVTVVVGLPVEEVLREFDDDDPAYAVEVDGVVVVFEVNGYRGVAEGVAERLSRNGRAAAAFWNINAHTFLVFARGGVEVASYEPDPCPSDDPEVLAAVAGLDFDDFRHGEAKLITAVARFTGHVVTRADHDAAHVETVE